MFHRKEKARSVCPQQIKIVGEAGTLFDGAWLELPFEEAVILQKSILFFDDPAPCMIHRSAVRVRLLAELEQDLAAKDLCRLCEYTGFQQVQSIEMKEVSL